MVAVAAVAFGAGALCLYYGARALRTRRAVRRLDAGDDGLGDPTDWLEPPSDRPADGESDAAFDSESGSQAVGETGPESVSGTDRRAGVSIERGFVLLALGLLCLLFGLFAL